MTAFLFPFLTVFTQRIIYNNKNFLSNINRFNFLQNCIFLVKSKIFYKKKHWTNCVSIQNSHFLINCSLVFYFFLIFNKIQSIIGFLQQLELLFPRFNFYSTLTMFCKDVFSVSWFFLSKLRFSTII